MENQIKVDELFRYVYLRRPEIKKTRTRPTVEKAPISETMTTYFKFADNNNYPSAKKFASESFSAKEANAFVKQIPAEIKGLAEELESGFKTGDTGFEKIWGLMKSSKFAESIYDDSSYLEFRKTYWEKLTHAIFSEQSPKVVMSISQALIVARAIKTLQGGGESSPAAQAEPAPAEPAKEVITTKNATKKQVLKEEVFKEEIGPLVSMPRLLLPEPLFNLLKNKEVPESGLKTTKSGGVTTAKTEERYVRVGSGLISVKTLCLDMSKEYNPCGILEPKSFSWGGNFTSKIFWGDLLVTRQSLVKYQMSEVAHLESIMKNEKKVRSFRRFDKTETTDFYEEETTTEEERDTQTTDRFSVEQTSSQTLNQDYKLDSGVNVSSSYGTTTVNASLGFSFGSNSSDMRADATSFSKDVTERSLTRIKNRIKKSKTINIIRQMEENSEHLFDNVGPDTAHINGVYRWLEKIYLNKIVNYGGRMMEELTIPEPASFYIFRKTLKGTPENSPIKPTHPKEYKDAKGVYISSFNDISKVNYALLAAAYNADVPVCPQEEIHVGIAITEKFATSIGSDGIEVISKSDTIAIPDGYKTTELFVDIAPFTHVNFNYQHSYKLSVGNWKNSNLTNTASGKPLLDGITANLAPYEKTIPYSFFATDVPIAGINIDITCKLTDIAETKWKQSVYSAILKAYESQLREFNDWVRSQQEDIKIQGNNPNINRKIEREELKKRAIEILSGQRFESFDGAVNGLQMQSGYPEILFNEARNEGKTVKYFEQVFEWENMTYIFYPYFWGRKNNWLTITSLTDENDPLFERFLHAGYARVVVPVRRGFEEYASGFCGYFSWLADMNPQYAPGVDAPWFVSIADELRWQNETPQDDPNRVVGHYLQYVPTNLVCIAPEDGKDIPALPDNANLPGVKEYL
jgi:hypothetical protein